MATLPARPRVPVGARPSPGDPMSPPDPPHDVGPHDGSAVPDPGDRGLREIDPATWTPTMRATLLFVFDHGHALLIRKKRGLGAGRINAPGGRIEPGETPRQAAERELFEEVGVRATDSEHRGELFFEFTDGLRLHVHVFVAGHHAGTPVETDEAIPLWAPLDALPYDEMWPDDRVWVPHLLAGRRFKLRARFDGEEMRACELWLPETGWSPACP